MNNAINEIKNALEGTNSRITEAEDWISEVEAFDEVLSTNVPWSQEFSGILRIWT